MDTILSTAVVNLWIAGLVSTDFLIARETCKEFRFQFPIHPLLVTATAYTQRGYVEFERVQGICVAEMIERINLYEDRVKAHLDTLSDCKETRELKEQSLEFWKELKQFIKTHAA